MSELEAILVSIDVIKARLDQLRPLNSERLQQALDIEYTYESNRIEGNTLNLRETDLVINKGLTIAGKPLREHLEAINHYEAILYIRDLATRQVELSEYEVRQIHALVLRGIDRENAGRYRQVPVRISGSRHEPPQPWDLIQLMQDYGLWLLSEEAKKLHPAVFAAEAHERLVTIHPFIDGNGRTSRLIMNLILLRYGYPIANISGDTESRLAYYDALEQASLTKNKEPFLRLIAGQIRQNGEKLLKILGAQ